MNRLSYRSCALLLALATLGWVMGSGCSEDGAPTNPEGDEQQVVIGEVGVFSMESDESAGIRIALHWRVQGEVPDSFEIAIEPPIEYPIEPFERIVTRREVVWRGVPTRKEAVSDGAWCYVEDIELNAPINCVPRSLAIYAVAGGPTAHAEPGAVAMPAILSMLAHASRSTPAEVVLDLELLPSGIAIALVYEGGQYSLLRIADGRVIDSTEIPARMAQGNDIEVDAEHVYSVIGTLERSLLVSGFSGETLSEVPLTGLVAEGVEDFEVVAGGYLVLAVRKLDSAAIVRLDAQGSEVHRWSVPVDEAQIESMEVEILPSEQVLVWYTVRSSSELEQLEPTAVRLSADLELLESAPVLGASSAFGRDAGSALVARVHDLFVSADGAIAADVWLRFRDPAVGSWNPRTAHLVLKLGESGQVASLAMSPPPTDPGAVAIAPDGNLYGVRGRGFETPYEQQIILFGCAH